MSSNTALPRADDRDLTLLIVDDDRDFALSAADFARTRGYTSYLAHSLAQTRDFARLPAVDLLLLDLNLPDGCGFDLIGQPGLPELGQIAIVTGEPTMESAARAVSQPVMDYLVKPLCPARFGQLLDRVAASARPAPSAERMGMIGRSAPMRRLAAQLQRVAPSPLSVLISGESGTGKELAARAVHETSGRSGAFVAVNCGAIAPDLLASHLFGHERGSFTGAASRHFGYLEQASAGTLFLDEITEMPPALQVYLLRVLETGRLTRVGGSDEIAVDLRLVAATNRDPAQAVAQGLLREDLYYRLADFHLEMPPLRSRGDDAALIARSLLERLNQRYGTRKRFADGTDLVLSSHPWPGNVRELNSTVQRAYLTAAGDEVRLVPGPNMRVYGSEDDPGSVSFRVGMSYADIERQMLLKTLAHFGRDRTRTARALGVSVRTIHNQIARLRESGHQVD
ncbi:sigma-54-dependent transcriptional regulator [Lysobacter silvisoli]|uniref:sigma-54-dependent transcriptional regulator n=1 Tax=Lysobacter silvisoli TaxID=2293254 RepID=UPI0011C03072|nr:sigma-54 dependent transcriptional regulator [Lysobacter silvisoli]